MSIGNFPHDLLIGSIKASNKAVSLSGHNCVIVQWDATASSGGHTSSSSSEHCLVIREIPNLSTSIFINRYKLTDLFGLKLRSLIQPVWASVWIKKKRSFSKTLYSLPPMVPAINSFLSPETARHMILESSCASWVKFHLPSAIPSFLTFQSPLPTNMWYGLQKGTLKEDPYTKHGLENNGIIKSVSRQRGTIK